MTPGSVLALAAALLALPAAAVPAAPPAPKLVVVISVDQFSADLFAEHRGRFTAGLRRLAEGAVFPSGYQSHAATETCPGHSTILTGARPARTGIIANDWYDLSLSRADKRVYCAEDPAVPGSSSTDYTPSVGLLKVPTLGDRMKAAAPADRVVAVAGKDRAAIMMGGHATDQIWFWAEDRYRTLDDHRGPVPAAVVTANARAAAMLARADPAILPRRCAASSQAVPVGGRTVGTLALRAAGDRRGYRASPAFDAATTDLAIGLLGELRLGRAAGTDLLIVGLSATDYVGHGFGTAGAEMCAQMTALDRQVGRLLTALDATRMPYVVALTADHGGHDLPERNDRRAIPDATRVDAALLPAAMDRAMRAEFALEVPMVIAGGPFGDVYIGRDVPAALRPRVIAALKARYLANPQVAAVFTRDELARQIPPSRTVDEWTPADRFRASFDPGRSGDLLVALQPHVVPIADPATAYVATHGSPWNYDRRVPMLFWWPGMAGFEQPVAVETVDIMPTLAALIGLPVPAAEVDGRCLDLDPGAPDTCKNLPRLK